MLRFLTLTAEVDDSGRRLDRILRRALPDLSLSTIHRLLRKGRVLVNGVPGKGADRIDSGSVIRIPIADNEVGAETPGTAPHQADNPADQTPAIPPFRASPASPSAPAKLSADILWEGSGLLVLNKPPGLLVHGPESLDIQVQAYLAGKLPPSLSFKPGPLHRLDKPTSGIVVFSETLEGARRFSALLQERRIGKRYLALVDGSLEGEATWEDILVRDRELRKSFIDATADAGISAAAGDRIPAAKATAKDAAKHARTRVYPLARAAGYTLVMLEIDTGRTHQIRAQAAAHGHPLAGDRKYGGSPQQGGFLLHAGVLELPPNGDGGPALPQRLEAPLPENFRRRIRELFGEFETQLSGIPN